MNIERLNIIAEWLEAGAPHKNGVVGFYMPVFFREDNECGTIACIGGCAVQWWGDEKLLKDYWKHKEKENVANLLRLDVDTANALFYPDSYPEDRDGKGPLLNRLEEVTPAWAARCIRKLMETGEVDWVGTQVVEGRDEP